MKKEPRLSGCTLPPVVLNGFPFIVYHWTTARAAVSILKKGLRRGSWVTQDPRNYKGEVLLGVCMDKPHNWQGKDEESNWQAILPEPVSQERVFYIQNPTLHRGGTSQTITGGKSDE